VVVLELCTVKKPLLRNWIIFWTSVKLEKANFLLMDLISFRTMYITNSVAWVRKRTMYILCLKSYFSFRIKVTYCLVCVLVFSAMT
jgi:hypothetical protein